MSSHIKFKDALLQSFIQVGLAEQDDETFVTLNYKKKGYLTRLIPQAQSFTDAISVGEIALTKSTSPTNADPDEFRRRVRY